MSNKYCCALWESVYPEVQEYFASKLQNVDQRYLVFPFVKMLHNINNYCPVCGEALALKGDVLNPTTTQPVASQEPPTSGQTTCPRCKGVGNLGFGDGGIPVACMTCLGEGKATPKPKVSEDKLAKIEELKAKIQKDQEKK
jgi:hypothetical protein